MEFHQNHVWKCKYIAQQKFDNMDFKIPSCDVIIRLTNMLVLRWLADTNTLLTVAKYQKTFKYTKDFRSHLFHFAKPQMFLTQILLFIYMFVSFYNVDTRKKAQK